MQCDTTSHLILLLSYVSYLSRDAINGWIVDRSLLMYRVHQLCLIRCLLSTIWFFDDRIFFVNVNGLRIKPEHLIQPTFMKEIYFRRRAYSMPCYLHFYYALIPKNFQ